MSDCKRLGRIFGGCKFEPRSDYIGKFNNVIESMKGNYYEPPSNIIEACKTEDKIYVCDVCIRCGKKVTRNNL